MPKDWMNKFLKDRQERFDENIRKAQLQGIANSQIPQMFRRLCAQITEDLAKYRSAPLAKQINAQPDQHTGAFTVEAQSYPHFWMQLLPASTCIEVKLSKRRSSSAPQVDEPEQVQIFVSADGAEELYYSIAGERYLDESGVSELLLKPLLEFIGG